MAPSRHPPTSQVHQPQCCLGWLLSLITFSPACATTWCSVEILALLVCGLSCTGGCSCHRVLPLLQLFVDAVYVAAFAMAAASIYYAPPILGSPFRELALGLWAAEAAFFLFGRWRYACVLLNRRSHALATRQLGKPWALVIFLPVRQLPVSRWRRNPALPVEPCAACASPALLLLLLPLAPACVCPSHWRTPAGQPSLCVSLSSLPGTPPHALQALCAEQAL